MSQNAEQKQGPDYSMGAILRWPVGGHIKVTILEMLRRPGRRTADDIGLSTRQSPELVSQALRVLKGEGLVVEHLPGPRTPQKRFEVTPGHLIRHALSAYEGKGELARQRQVVSRVDGSGWGLEDAVTVLETLAAAGITSTDRIAALLGAPEAPAEEPGDDPNAEDAPPAEPAPFSAAEARKAKLAAVYEAEPVDPEDEDNR